MGGRKDVLVLPITAQLTTAADQTHEDMLIERVPGIGIVAIRVALLVAATAEMTSGQCFSTGR